VTWLDWSPLQRALHGAGSSTYLLAWPGGTAKQFGDAVGCLRTSVCLSWLKVSPVLALSVSVRTGWLSYYKIFKMPVLVSLNPADTARAMEKQKDKEVVEEALQVGPAGPAALDGATTGLVLGTEWADSPGAGGVLGRNSWLAGCAGWDRKVPARTARTCLKPTVSLVCAEPTDKCCVPTALLLLPCRSCA
jgi:hypothetical protein